MQGGWLRHLGDVLRARDLEAVGGAVGDGVISGADVAFHGRLREDAVS